MEAVSKKIKVLYCARKLPGCHVLQWLISNSAQFEIIGACGGNDYVKNKGIRSRKILGFYDDIKIFSEIRAYGFPGFEPAYQIVPE